MIVEPNIETIITSAAATATATALTITYSAL